MNKETSNWKVNVTSFSDRFNLSDEQIDDVLHCYKNEEYVDFITNFNKKMHEQYDKNETAKWQNFKKEELEKKFFSNLKYSILNDIIKIEIEFDVLFTESFEEADVYNWIEGFNRLLKIHPMVQQKKIIKGEHIDDNEQLFLEELLKNENLKVIKIKS